LGSIGIEIASAFYSKFEITCIDHGRYFDIIKQKFPELNLIKSDIHEKGLIKKLAKDSDIIYYLVDTGGVVGCMNNPTKFYEINTTKFSNLVKELIGFDVHFFLLSSVFVYPNSQNCTEETKPKPETLYGKLRLKQEQILESNNIKSTILRVSNIFGYGNFVKVGNSGAIEKFIENIFSDKQITLHANGNQLVDYLYKNDLIFYLKNLVSESPGEIYNISTGKLQKIINIAEIISNIGKNLYQKNIRIKISNKNQIYPSSPLASSAKIIKKTHHNPSLNFNEKIQNMMDTYLQYER
jgi:nucleoside-diphosphate-sugar epimerase